ncbi:hypothetical protein BC751_1165 [Cecembia calidifontis]|uniref:Uncharacterized protein n=2 Tax=Cecembia calidifontis TaxID=1187080 RepID=A0A4Q7P6K8_9BACT|nr:hypothetical protein BC751_1165 [Cecembia calidifontis]
MPKVFLIGLGFFLFLSSYSFAQSEREKSAQDLPKNSDGIGHFESLESSSFELRNEQLNRTNTNQNRENSLNSTNSNRRENPIYKQGGERDVKKEGMSTLSFNLFLYIVDKFKED